LRGAGAGAGSAGRGADRAGGGLYAGFSGAAAGGSARPPLGALLLGALLLGAVQLLPLLALPLKSELSLLDGAVLPPPVNPALPLFAAWLVGSFLSPLRVLAVGDLVGSGLLEIAGITGGAMDGLGIGDSVTSGFLPPQAPNMSAILPMSKIRILIDPVLPALMLAFTVSILYRVMSKLTG
jgi:hypothetical protein